MVSIIIPIRNEATNLPRCLASVAWADEVWVVDSASTDGSQAIVEAEDRRRRTEGPSDDGTKGPRDQGAKGREAVESPIAEKLKAASGTPTQRGGRKLENGDLSSEVGGQRTEGGDRMKPRDGDLKPEGEGPNAERGNLKPEKGGRVHLVQFQFNGTWPKKKNWALENLPFKHEWVFILDADEVLPPEAEAEIRAIVEDRGQRTEDGGRGTEDGGQRTDVRGQGTEGRGQSAEDGDQRSEGDAINGYWINRRFMFMGQWLKHAYYPNWNLRLFRHKLGRYEKLTEAATASGDNEVHEHVIVQGRTGRLRSEMDHYAFPDVGTFVEKHNRYSNWEARVALERGLGTSSGQLQSGRVGWRRKLKVLSHRLPFRPTLRFLYVYVSQCGFLDGWAGYYFARMHAMYELLCVAKEHELRRKAEGMKAEG